MHKLITLIFGIITLINSGFALAYSPDKIGLQNAGWLKTQTSSPL
jgi:hypothetical protein